MIGVSVIREVTGWVVEIEGRGGDSAHDEYYKTEEGALYASALDGQNRKPRTVRLFELSNGSFIEPPDTVPVRDAPEDAKMEELLEKVLTPALKVYLSKRK